MFILLSSCDSCMYDIYEVHLKAFISTKLPQIYPQRKLYSIKIDTFLNSVSREKLKKNYISIDTIPLKI